MDRDDREPEHEARERTASRVGGRWRRAIGRVRSAVRRGRAAVGRAAAWTVPGRRVRRGAAAGAVAGVVALAAHEGLRLYSGFGLAVDLLFFAGFGAVVVAAGILAFRLVSALVRALPRYVGVAGAGALAGLAFFAAESGEPPPAALLLLIAPVVIVALVGGALAFVTGAGFGAAGWGRRAAGIACLAAGLAGGIALALWLAAPGTAEHLVAPAEASARPAPSAGPADLTDPGLPGPYPVAHLTYGSGDDARRPEFGADADLTTPTVDGTPFLKGFDGWSARMRERFWGFGKEELPLNGRAWYPDAPPGSGADEGPFPLVLIVHGNHNMGDDSDTGYGYLGEHLASRGFVFVSVDENFLNGHHLPGPSNENDARGWLMLEHLSVWRDWNEDPESPFHGKVDLERIGLIGHSRGGEAVGHAAAFNRLRAWPDDAAVRFDYDFGIRAVVAIAPSDGQYQPADRRTPLSDVAYLTIQGGHDGDVSLWAGDRQRHRVRFTRQDPRLFAAGVFLYRANHGQFNTSWGRFDHSPPRSWLLNTAPLMDPEEQRRAARTLIGGFLEATLHDETGYREMFRDLATARDWLPDGVYAARYRDGGFRALADFEEDIDVTTGSAPGSRIRIRGLVTWREQDVPLRGGSTRHDQGAYVGWRERAEGKEPPLWAVSVPAEWAGAPGGSGAPARLSLDLARAPEEPKGGGDDEDDEDDGQDDGEPGSAPVDLTLELADRAGAVARLPLSRFGPELRALPSRFSKLDSVEDERYGTRPEPVFQTYSVPLAAFAEATPGFDPASLAEVRLVFDRSPEGVIIVDELGFSEE